MSRGSRAGVLDLDAIEARIALPPGADPEWRFAATSALQLLAEVRVLRTALRPPTDAELIELGEYAVNGYLDFVLARQWFEKRAAVLGAPERDQNVTGGTPQP